MNRLERIDDKEAAMLAILRGWQAGVYTAMPAVIDSFNKDKQTCEAVVAIQAKVTDKTGASKWVTLPKLVDVPVDFPSGGGYTLTFPVKQGDEALIVFSSRCIDNWWAAGGVRTQADLRMHDLSDGVAFVGIRSLARLLTGGVKTTAAQLRADDGATYIEIADGQLVNILAPGGINLNGVTIDNAGNVTTPATIWGKTEVKFGPTGKNTTTHAHNDPQGGITGAPI